MYRTKLAHNDITDEYFIILPTELMEEMGIKEGDNLTWVIEEDKIYLRKNNS